MPPVEGLNENHFLKRKNRSSRYERKEGQANMYFAKTGGGIE
jgi:hypothetical protein